MIIRFSVENWMSFRDRVAFSMIGTRERQHQERLPKITKYQMRLLPIATIYGGNASGKTNLFKALSFARFMITRGTQPDGLIPVDPYRLDSEALKRPTSFEFELLIDDSVYEFRFVVSRKAVFEEKLVAISSTSERVLYHRRGNEMQFDKSLAKNQFLQFAFKGTRDNQLFLTNSVSQKVEDFRPIYDWFKNELTLVAPDSRFQQFEQYLEESSPLFTPLNDLIPQLDTGIARLGGELVPMDNILLPEFLRSKLREELKEGMTMKAVVEPSGERFLFTRKDGQIQARRLVAYHAVAGGGEARFEICQESDGSQRVIELMPAFLAVAAPKSKKVYVIDEVDRSLHTLLTRRLLESYLETCNPESRSQLLVTTHDVLLMDQDLLRRDEMWIAERDLNGSSKLTSFGEFRDVRYDKDVRKSYLQGRLGGIPRLLLGGRSFASSARDEGVLE